MGRAVEKLFLRYRTKGDANALAEVFERTAPSVLRVALHLARDPAAAEDLLQATFLAAMESADSFDGERTLVPWLLGILSNQARKRAGQDRRPDPERLRALPATDPGQAASDREMDEAVGRSIHGLPDPYRQVLALHLEHGLAPAEIASALDRSPGTVRSQLARGMEMLRRSLPMGFTAAVLLTGRGLAAVKREVMARAAPLAPAAPTLLMGAVVMKKSTLVMAGLLAVALLAALVFPELGPFGSSSGGATPPSGEPLVGRLSVAAADVEVASQESTPTAGSRLELRSRDGEPFGSVSIRLLWEDNHAPAGGVGARIVAWEQSNRLLYPEYRLSNDEGRVHFESIHAGEITVYTSTGAVARSEVAPGAETDVDVLIPRGLSVDGTVVDEAGAGVPGAEVWLCHPGAEFRGLKVAVTDAWGRFALEGVSPQDFLSPYAEGYRPGRLVPVVDQEEGLPGQKVVRLTLSSGSASLRGTVVDAAGTPLAGVQVQVSPENEVDVWGRVEMRADGTLPRRLRTGVDGTFASRGLPPGPALVSARHPDLVPAQRAVTLSEGGEVVLALALVEGVEVVGRVSDGSGSPVAGALITSGDYGFFSHYTTTSRRDGSYRLRGLPPDPEVQAFTGGTRHVMAQLRALGGETVRWDPVLSGGLEIRGVVRMETGEPLADWEVWVWGERGERGTVTTDQAGRFVLGNRLDEEHTLEVRGSAETWTMPPLLTVTGVRCEDRGVELIVSKDSLQLGSVRGVVSGPDGPLVAQVRGIYGDGQSITLRTETDPETGAFLLDRLPPMEYRLSVQVEGYPTLHRNAVVYPGRDLDLGMLRMEPGHRLELELRADPEPEVSEIQLVGPQGRIAMRREPGSTWSATLVAGRYELLVEGENFLSLRRALIVDGTSPRVQIDLRPAARQVLRFTLPATGNFPSRLHVRIEDANGEMVRATSLFGDVGVEYRWAVGLAPGRYRVTAEASSGLAGALSFAVAEDADALPIDVALK